MLVDNFSQFILKGPRQALAVCLVLFLVPLPLFSFLGTVIIALVTLRKGHQAGFIVSLATIPALFLSPKVSPILLLLISIIATYGMAIVLRQTQSWSATFIIAAIASLSVPFILPLFIEPQVFMDQIINVLQNDKNSQTQDWVIALKTMVPSIFTMMGTALYIQLVMALVVARWLQSRLFNPGGLKTELMAARISGAQAMALFIVGVGLFMLTPSNKNLVAIPLLPFLIVGIIIVQGIINQLPTLRMPLLVAFYALLILTPISLFIIGIGLIDPWVDFRQKLNKQQE